MISFPAVPVRNNRTWINIVGVLITLSLALSFCRKFLDEDDWPRQNFFTSSSGVYSDPVAFGHSLLEALETTPPGLRALQLSSNAEALVFWKASNDTPRPDLVPMRQDEVATMRVSHDAYREKARQLQVPFSAQTRGVVSTAGGAYLPIFVVSLRMLRRTGCTLPVELFLISEEEHGQYLCDTLLPSLNARCVRLTDFLGPKASTIAKYQLKIFSMLFSSFESILFLDADNFPVEDPSHLFTSEPFRSTGLVSWPDFWASSASKHLFSIQSRSVPLMNTLPSTESGQLLVSKRSHAQALLLTAYYNFYGPDFYYPLLSQGGFGEGDKETFLAGAQAVGAPFYQVQKCVDTIGYYENERYHGVAMLQYDPTADGQPRPTPFALHHNYPKLDPVQLFSTEGAAINHATGEHHRLLGPKELTMERFGRDLESEIWDEVEFVACELGSKFRHWKAVETVGQVKGTCGHVVAYRAAVFT